MRVAAALIAPRCILILEANRKFAPDISPGPSASRLPRPRYLSRAPPRRTAPASTVSRLRRFRYFSVCLDFLAASAAVSRYFCSFWGDCCCVPKVAPVDKSSKKEKWSGDKAPNQGQPKHERNHRGNGTNHDKHHATKPPPKPDRPGLGQPGLDGLLFLLGRFSAILPGLSYPLSYRRGGYPSRYTNRADFRRRRNASPRTIPHFPHTASDVTSSIGVTQVLALQSSL